MRLFYENGVIDFDEVLRQHGEFHFSISGDENDGLYCLEVIFGNKRLLICKTDSFEDATQGKMYILEGIQGGMAWCRIDENGGALDE